MSVAEQARRATVTSPGSPSRVRTTGGAVVSVVAVAGCAWWASRQQAPTLPSGLGNVCVMLLSIGVYAVAVFLRGWRWDQILRYMEIRHRTKDAYALTCVGYMGNTVLPARGGEVLRIFLLAERSHARRREVLGSIITERLLDVGALAVLVVVLAALQVGGAPGGDLVPVLAGSALVVTTVVGYGYLRLRRSGRFEAFANRIRPVARASRQLLSGRGAFLGLVTCAIWCLDGTVLCLGAHALNVSLTFGEAVFVVVSAGVSALIPAGPGMIGTFDAAALFALHHVGIRGGDAVSCLLLFRFVAFVPVTVVGLGLMLGRYGGLRAALRRESQPEAA
jgi:glycosyltransferase 2 family protein